MSRLIKFRAWDEKHNRMIYDDILVYHEEGRLFSGISDPNEDWSEPQLLQFTGLLDKNGVEIYEGDILRVDEMTFKTSGPLPDILTVNYYVDTFELWKGDQPLFGLKLSYAKSCEVIGNIYQNKELVDVK